MIGTVCSRPMRSLAQPHWNTATTTPYAAAMPSRFMTTAFAATTGARNTAVSSRKLSETTEMMKTGRRSLRRWEMSM